MAITDAKRSRGVVYIAWIYICSFVSVEAFCQAEEIAAKINL